MQHKTLTERSLVKTFPEKSDSNFVTSETCSKESTPKAQNGRTEAGPAVPLILEVPTSIKGIQ